MSPLRKKKVLVEVQSFGADAITVTLRVFRHSGCSSSKSPQKQKAKSAGSQEESKANAAAASHEIATVPIELKPPGLKDVKALFSRRKPCAPKIKSQQTRFDPGQLSLSDSVKTDTRRMSSARAIASIDEMPNGGLSLKSASVKNDLHDSSAKKPKRIKSEDVTGSSRSPTKNAAKRANCSVQCEPFSSLPVEALDQKTFVIKQGACCFVNLRALSYFIKSWSCHVFFQKPSFAERIWSPLRRNAVTL